MPNLPQRKQLDHETPPWVKENALYFVTICAHSRGVNQLCHPDVGEKLLHSAIFYHEQKRWWLDVFLLMPDHVHMLVAVPRSASLATTVRKWKEYLCKNVGVKWQTGFFDHRLRSDESANDKAVYIRMNPVRAGLVSEPNEWPYCWPKL